MFLGKDGERIALYRKTHLWDPFLKFERLVFAEGAQAPPLVDFMGARIGLLICWDVEFPENCRALALRGAEVVIAIAANCDEFVLSHIVKVRAFENLFHLAYCNAPGEPFCGSSSVCSPQGTALISLPRAESIETVEIAPQGAVWDHVRLRNPFFQFRRPALYGAVA